MKILTIHQPWASLIAVGAKVYETRSWETRYRGPIAIHASMTWNRELARLCTADPFYGALLGAGFSVSRGIWGRRSAIREFGLPFGTIVAVADLTGCYSTDRPWDRGWGGDKGEHEEAFGDYSPGRFGWHLANVRRLAEPIRVRGCQGLRDLPAGVSALIDSQRSLA